ncbi:MAG: hypothetical protein LBQ86_00730 [Holophagales bacterium]|jgi:hypothetical protein|nr:hypothetical protein [Holophagales bacterium]
MKNINPEKLLGGYAPGILRDGEKLALFSAALEDQELFNALMDEDALKQILDCPEFRARVMAALDSTAAPPAKIRPFWQKPLWMGVAASMFLVFMASYSLKRSGAPLPPEQSAKVEQVKAEAIVAPSDPIITPGAESKGREITIKNTEKDMAQAEQPGVKNSPEAAKKTAASANKSVLLTEDAGKDAAAPNALQEDVANISGAASLSPLQHSALRAAPLARSAKAQGKAGVASKDAIVFSAEAAIKAEANELSKPDDLPELNTKTRAPKLPNPVWTVTRLDNGRLGVKVVRTVINADIVLLLRSDSGVSVIVPKKQSNNDFYYEVDIASGDRLDLYQLNYKASDHLTLPESGPIDGQRVRIFG